MTNGHKPDIKQEYSPEAAALLSTQGDPYAFPSLTPVHGGTGFSFDAWLMQYDPNRLELPGWWSRLRDMRLRQYLRQSVILSSVVYQRAASAKNTPWHIEAENPALESELPKYHDLINNSQFGDGFRGFLELYTQDLLCQDNGAFIELIGDGQETYHEMNGIQFCAKGFLEKWNIKGFAHIDAAQCWRTNNREYPVVYTNPWTGEITVFHWTRIIANSQMTQPIERGRGIGFCAASRAFMALEIMEASNLYLYEKLVGQSPELAIAKGVAVKAIQKAIEDNAIANDNLGRVRYKGITFLQGDVLPNGDPDIKIIGLKGVPDGYDREQEMTLAIYMIAMAFGTDVRDLGWAAQNAGDTKADAEIQDMKTSNRGRSDVLRDLEFAITRRMLPAGLSFVFDAKDDLEDQRKAEIAQIRAATRQIQIASGELSAGEARTMAATFGDIDSTFLDAETTLDENANPLDTDIQQEQESEPIQQIQEDAKAVKNKAYTHTRSVFQSQMQRALRRYRRTGNVIDFRTRATQIINVYGARAYVDGLNAGGAIGAGLGDLSDDERREMNMLINIQVNYVGSFNSDLSTVANADYHASLWTNKGLDGIYNAGLIAGAKNGNLEWLYGDTEHCADCLNLNGRVYRASIWKKYDIQPKGDGLQCGGYNCQCKLIKTTKPVTKGRPPNLIGRK